MSIGSYEGQSNILLYRFGKLVFATCTSGTVTASGGDTLTTMPDAYKPKQHAIIWLGDGKRLDVKTDGTLTTSNTLSSYALRFSACWMAT